MNNIDVLNRLEADLKELAEFKQRCVVKNEGTPQQDTQWYGSHYVRLDRVVNCIESLKFELSKLVQPQGWKLVPIDPTDAMLKDGLEVPWLDAEEHQIECIWENMLAATPQPKGGL